MFGFGTLLTWLLAAAQAPPPVAEAHPWVEPLAYVAAVVFVFILLAGVYLIVLALKQRKQEDLSQP